PTKPHQRPPLPLKNSTIDSIEGYSRKTLASLLTGLKANSCKSPTASASWAYLATSDSSETLTSPLLKKTAISPGLP
ncbi:MAG: hypothetical protein LM573_02240, partial [Thermofilum sp.]|nr:hypothetical protein [Thermofilum sp.]